MQVLTEIEPDAIAALHADGEFFWLDLVDPSPVELEALGHLLDLHPAALEDTLEWEQIPKLDDYGDHVTLVFYSARIVNGQIAPVETHVYVAGGFMLTARHGPCPLEGLRLWIRDAAPDTEDEAVYHVLNALADGWDPVVAELDRRVDVVEGEVLERPRKDHLTTIYRLKQETGELLRLVAPQRDLLPIAVDTMHGIPGLERGSREWLRDVVTHVDSITGDMVRLQEDLQALTSTFFNASAYRLNRLATLIAIGSVFFLVWTLVTSFFGQNFGYLVRSVDSRTDFLVYGVGGLAVPTAAIAGLLYWRRNDWR